MVGREAELAVLRNQLTSLVDGKGGLALISGPAGIGKTTLVQALTEEAAARGVRVVTGGCYDLTETPPYGPWLEITSAWTSATFSAPFPLAAIHDGQTTASGDRQLFSAVRDCVAGEAARAPLVLILEDVHWADPASLEMLRRLAREARPLPVLLVATYRSDEVERGHRLYPMLPVLIREAQATRLDLRPLDHTTVRTLLALRYTLRPTELRRLLEYVQARGEGNPFFLQELLRELEADGVLQRAAQTTQPGDVREPAAWRLGDLGGATIPPLLQQVLDRRLDRFAENERRLLAVAAVIGQEVPLPVWGEVTISDDELIYELVDRAVVAQVLVTPNTGTSVRFAHALIREALYEGLLPPRRRLWHRRIAEVLLARPTADPDAVAYQLRQAGDHRAAEWLVRAGRRAQEAYAWLSAAERYDAALALLEHSGAAAEDRAALLLMLAQLRRYSDPEWGIQHLVEAERLVAGAGNATLAAAAQFDRGHLRCMVRDFEAGLADMQAGLRQLETVPAEERASVPSLDILGIPAADRGSYHRGVLTLFLAILGRFPEVEARTAPADAVGTTAREYLAHGWLNAALGRPQLAREAFGQAREAYEEQYWEVGTTYFYELDLVVVPYQTEGLEDRRRLADEAELAWTRASGALSGISPRLARLPLFIVEGQWREAREVALATLGASQANDAWRRYPAPFLAWLAREQGDVDLAWQIVGEEFPNGPATSTGGSWFLPSIAIQRVAALLAIDRGDLPLAREWLTAHDRWLEWSRSVRGRAEGHFGWAVYAYALDDLELAQTRTRRALWTKRAHLDSRWRSCERIGCWARSPRAGQAD